MIQMLSLGYISTSDDSIDKIIVILIIRPYYGSVKYGKVWVSKMQPNSEISCCDLKKEKAHRSRPDANEHQQYDEIVAALNISPSAARQASA